MTIVKSLRTLLILQLVMWAIAVNIDYNSYKPGAAEFSGLDALFPMGIFAILGLVNIVLLIIYVVRLTRSHARFDIYTGVLLVLVIVSIPAFSQVDHWLLMRSLQSS